MDFSPHKLVFSEFPFPNIVWKKEDCTKSDLGYVRGCFSDGRFFYAQLYCANGSDDISLNLIFSSKGFQFDLENEPAGDRFVNDVEHMRWKKSVLTKGLPIYYGGYGERFSAYQNQIMEYLLKEGVLKFFQSARKDYQMYLSVDQSGERMIVVSVLLKSGSFLHAKLGYDFLLFRDEIHSRKIRFIVEMPEEGRLPNGNDAGVYGVVIVT